MNFDFSEDQKALQGDAARLLRQRGARATARRSVSGEAAFPSALWNEVAALGWTGVAVPERHGGSDLGFEALCLLSEEVGRTLAPIPFLSSSVAMQAIMTAGTPDEQDVWLPMLADGSRIGTLALFERPGDPTPDAISARVTSDRLYGSKVAVPDGGTAHLAVVAARHEGGDVGLFVVALDHPSVARTATIGIDGMRPHAELRFSGTPCVRLTVSDDGWGGIETVLAKAAVLTAFEQIGGAQACLEMARDHALARVAFGRPIGAFQAIKHKLAHLFVAIELARSNAAYGAWAATRPDRRQLLEAAACARISASEAFERAATENIQTHGGIGYTWDSECHLFHRRAKLLAVNLGSARFWSRILADLVIPTCSEASDGL